MNVTPGPFAVLALTLALTGCPRAPCDAADVQKVIEVCRVVVAGSPEFKTCRRAGLTPPTGFDFLSYDTQACSEQGQGRLMSCAASRSQACLTDAGVHDYSRVDAVMASCSRFEPPLPAAPPASCTPCDTTLQTCLAACPTSDWDGCAACVAPCELAYARCLNQCS